MVRCAPLQRLHARTAAYRAVMPRAPAVTMLWHSLRSDTFILLPFNTVVEQLLAMIQFGTRS